MNTIQEVRDGFIRVYEDIMRAKGLPTIMGRIMAVLLMEEQELSHKEISRLTGYSMASVNRTLNQLVNFGLVHKHKDPNEKHYVFHSNVNFPELFASSLEKMITVYGTQQNELNKLVEKLDNSSLEETEQVEADRLRDTLEKFESILRSTTEVLEDTVKELRSRNGLG
jgi:DNA-binding transcriptional regulator GbsR (MarR family)